VERAARKEGVDCTAIVGRSLSSCLHRFPLILRRDCPFTWSLHGEILYDALCAILSRATAEGMTRHPAEAPNGLIISLPKTFFEESTDLLWQEPPKTRCLGN
jgi:hypothetical protein